MHLAISVIIVNYNVRYFLEHCLLSVLSATKNISAEIIIVDNNSTDSDYEWLTSQYPQVIWLPLPTNIGFAKANNMGIQKAKGDCILFLNPDTLIPEYAIKKALDFFGSNTHCGALGVHMMDGKGQFLPESKRSVPTPLVSFYKLTGLSAIFPKSSTFGRYALTNLSAKDVHSVPILAGAFMMVRKTLLDKVGGFDEKFFMYGEDIDLSYRLQNNTGFTNFFLGNLPILHFKGESSKQNLQKHYKVFYEAMKIFVQKYHAGIGGWLMQQSLNVTMRLQLLLKTRKQENGPQAPTLSSFSCFGDQKTQDNLLQRIAIQYPKAKFQPLSTHLQQDIIICIGENFGYEKAIQYIIGQKASSHNFYWFTPRAAAIIGSNQKDATGVVWPI